MVCVRTCIHTCMHKGESKRTDVKGRGLQKADMIYMHAYSCAMCQRCLKVVHICYSSFHRSEHRCTEEQNYACSGNVCTNVSFSVCKESHGWICVTWECNLPLTYHTKSYWAAVDSRELT